MVKGTKKNEMAKGYCSLELYDIETGNVNSYITSGSCTSFISQIRSMEVNVVYAGFGPYSFADYLSWVQGQSYTNIPTGSRLYNPQLYITLPDNTVIFNDDYTGSYQSNQIPPLASGISGLDPAQIIRIPENSTFTYLATTPSTSALTGKVRFELFKTSGGNYPYFNYESPDDAWASYRLAPSGTTAHSGGIERGVVSYAIEMANDVVITNSGQFSTGLIPTLPTLFSTGTDIRQTYLMYCINSNGLDCETNDLTDQTICYTGVRTGTAYNIYISGVINTFKNSAATPYDNLSSLDYISSTEFVNIFGFWSGQLEFNNWMSGDRLYFELYPFNYLSVYGQYFNSAPPYPSTGFYLQYPQDFINIDQLISGLNKHLYSGTGLVSYPVWYDYPCLRGSGLTGAYFTGALLQAEKLNDNLVSFYSLRNIQSGYSMYLDLVPRTDPQVYSGLKYLMPYYVALQGSYDNSSWLTLDAHSGIDWTGISPTILTVTGIFPEDNVSVVPAIQPDQGDFIDILTGTTGELITLFTFTQSGYQNPGDKCPPVPFSREISVVYPSGMVCPTGGDEPPESGQKESPQTGQIPPIYEYSFLRTGWNIYTPQNSTLAKFPYYDYNYYRVYLSGFNTYNSGHYVNSNRFVVNNINLFYGVTGKLPIFTGADECIIGANYTVDIQGNVAVRITGDLSTTILTENSGIKCYDNALVTGLISGLGSGDNIQFNIASGKLTSSIATGFLTTCVTGTGCVETGFAGFFYDTGTNEITTSINFSDCTSNGSGIITGEWIQLKQSVVNEELALGGFLNPATFINIITGAFFTGIITGKETQTNLSGWFNLPITATGYSISGIVTYAACFTGLTPTLYYGSPTGYINSTGLITYNNPTNFDYISINTNQIFFNNDTVNYQPPNFYSSYDSLLTIINANPLIYQVTGSGDGSGIYLTSLISGSSGNFIELSAGTSTGAPYISVSSGVLNGGADLYQTISGTGEYSGCVNLTIPMTGFYTNDSGIASITGIVSTFLGVRDFSGVWNVITGNQPFIQNFRDNGWFYNNNMYSGSVSGLTLGNIPSNFRIFIDYNNLFSSPNLDVVQLNVWDTNFGPTGSGVGFLLTGII